MRVLRAAVKSPSSRFAPAKIATNTVPSLGWSAVASDTSRRRPEDPHGRASTIPCSKRPTLSSTIVACPTSPAPESRRPEARCVARRAAELAAQRGPLRAAKDSSPPPYGFRGGARNRSMDLGWLHSAPANLELLLGAHAGPPGCGEESFVALRSCQDRDEHSPKSWLERSGERHIAPQAGGPAWARFNNSKLQAPHALLDNRCMSHKPRPGTPQAGGAMGRFAPAKIAGGNMAHAVRGHHLGRPPKKPRATRTSS